MNSQQTLHHRDLEELFRLLKSRAPSLVPICLWLLLGPGIAGIALEGKVDAPTVPHLVRLVRRVRKSSQRLLPVIYQLLERSELRHKVLVHVQLDELLRESTWHHPTEVLERPQVSYRQLLKGARARLEKASVDQRPDLEKVVAKLDRAVRIDDDARRRRLRVRGPRGKDKK